MSILAGSTPGVHPAFFVSLFVESAWLQATHWLKPAKILVTTEFAKNFDGTENHDTVVVEFPCEFDENATVAKDMSAIDQLELIKTLQFDWADNAVSCTVYYHKEELPEIKKWLSKNFKNNIKSVSFLLHSDHGFVQAPYEEIDEEHYLKSLKRSTYHHHPNIK